MTPDTASQDNRAKTQIGRPVSLTIVCVVGWALLLAAMARIGTSWDSLLHLSAGRAFAGIAATLALAIALLGYWRLRRWGLWLVALTILARFGISALSRLPLQPADIALPVFLVIIGALYWKRLR